MSDWSSGYVTDIGYTHGYYPELNPLHAGLGLLNAGFKAPEINAACELGFGQGLSINIHSAASDTSWYGTDFNPSQVAYASDLAAISKAKICLCDDSFEEFACRTDLPNFDFIAMHGIWSWVSEENRAVLVDFVRRKLRVGGVLYISYNTMPGWSDMIPLRYLMTQYAEKLGARTSGIDSKIKASLEFADKLFECKPAYARSNPAVVERLGKLKGQDARYLAHEYFNRDWHPMPFTVTAEHLSGAKLSYACSANYFEHVDVLNLTSEQQTFMASISDPTFRELVRDFIINQQFRREYWIKGPLRLNANERNAAMKSKRVVLLTDPVEVTAVARGARGEATMNEQLVQRIVEVLSDHVPHSMAELGEKLDKHGISESQIIQTVLVLLGKHDLGIANEKVPDERIHEQALQLNRHLIEQAVQGKDVDFLASPLLGSGVYVGRMRMLFLRSYLQGCSAPEVWANAAWETISSLGQQVMKKGVALQTQEESQAELHIQAQLFLEKRLPILKALGVIKEPV